MSTKPIEQWPSMGQVSAYLRAKGVPPSTIKRIRASLENDAIQYADAARYDRIYTAVALACRREFGWGINRTMRMLRAFDQVCGETLGADGRAWEDIMKELEDELRIVIRMEDDKVAVREYVGEGEDVNER